jgi:hypothetical protein
MKRIAILVTALWAGLCWGALPATQPAESPATQPQRPEMAPAPPYAEHGGSARPARQITAQQEQELLEALHQRQPERYERLVKLRQENPKAYRRLLGMGWWWYQQWKDLPPEAQQAHFKVAEMRVQIVQRLHELRQAKDDDQRREAAAHLRQAVSELLSAERVTLEHRLAELQKRVADMQRDLQQRRENHEQMVDRHVEQLITPGDRKGRRHEEDSVIPPPPPPPVEAPEGPAE